jgi:hypothetical protein
MPDACSARGLQLPELTKHKHKRIQARASSLVAGYLFACLLRLPATTGGCLGQREE